MREESKKVPEKQELGVAFAEMENLGRQEASAEQAHGLLSRCLLAFQNGGHIAQGCR